ncbi:MAG: hypothetical protein KF900_09500 [Bacteroidetes bacterium]|nr:hypothetical protein [Bacteroidota bacterium]
MHIIPFGKDELHFLKEYTVGIACVHWLCNGYDVNAVFVAQFIGNGNGFAACATEACHFVNEYGAYFPSAAFTKIYHTLKFLAVIGLCTFVCVAECGNNL